MLNKCNPDDLKIMPSQSKPHNTISAEPNINRFDHDFGMNSFIGLNAQNSSQENSVENEEEKTTFEEESRRFNNDYFKMFIEDSKKHDEIRGNNQSDDEYAPDFEEIEEEIQYDEKDSSRSSYVSKKRKSTMKPHKFPKELEDNPYLYYAKKAKKKSRKMGKKESLKKQDTTSSQITKNNRTSSTDQSLTELEAKAMKDNIRRYRPYSPPFAQIGSQESEVEEVLDTDFVPLKDVYRHI
jgi:hypothetical protein